MNLMRFQASIIKFIQAFHTPLLDALFIAITNLGSEAFYYIVIPYFYWGKNKRLGLKIAGTLIFSIYLNVLLKEITAVPRPITYPGIRSLFVSSAGGFSFPSGHAQGTATLWGIIMFYYNSAAVKAIGAFAIALVSISRLYLGVHWPQDVIVGIALGLVIAYSSLRFEITTFNDNLPLKLILSSLIPLTLAIVNPHPDICKYMGMLAGILSGASLETKYIGFEPKYSGRKKSIIKYCIGAIIFVLMYSGLKSLLPPGILSVVTRYFLIGLWLSLGAPLIFKKLKL
jgi:membrane-associated phospholipid phosphatase